MQRQCSILCGLIVFLSLVACTAGEPGAAEAPTPIVVETAEVEGEPFCYAECINSLQIRLGGAQPKRFALVLTTEAGPVSRVHCANGHAYECWSLEKSYCYLIDCFGGFGRQGVIRYGEPDSFDVTVTWDGNQIVEHIEPSYREIGDCFGHTCYSAEVTITLPESP